MTHNDEKDGYKNNSLVANYSQNLSNELKFTSNFRFSDTYKQYDKEVNTSTATHSEAEDSIQSSANLAFQYKYDEKFINEVSLSQTYIKRIYNAAPGSGNTIKDNYYGDRYNYGYKGIYNFDLDNSIIFGVEREDDQIGYNKDLTGKKLSLFIPHQLILIIKNDLQKMFMLHLVLDLMIIQLQVMRKLIELH